MRNYGHAPAYFLTWLSLALLMCSPVFANTTPESLGRSYVLAVNKSDVEDIRSLIHPECPPSLINEEVLARIVKRTVPPNYKIQVIDLKPDNEILKFGVPAVKSEKLMNIAYEDESGKRNNLMLFATPKDGRWYLVQCSKRPLKRRY